MRRWTRYSAALLVALLPAGQTPARTAEDAAAIERGRQALTWIQGYQCPDINTPLTVAGLATPDDTARVRRENWAYANSRLAAVAEAVRARRMIEAEAAAQGSKPSARLDRAFVDLDDSVAAAAARTTSALAQWMLASWVEMSRLDGGLDLVGGKHPLAAYAADGRNLAALAAGFGGALTPLVEKYDRCLSTIQGAMIEYNSAQINAAVQGARSPDALGRIIGALEAAPSPPESAGGKLIADIRARREAMVLAAAEAEQRRRAAASADLRARLQQEAAAGQAVAARYVRAINGGDVNTAISLLHENVRLIVQKDSATGKQAVAQRMRNAAAEDKGIRPEPPQVDSNFQIFSTIRTQRGSGRMYFTVAAGKIDQIRLVQE